MSVGLSPVRLTAVFDGTAVKMGAKQAAETIRTGMAKAEPALTKAEQGFDKLGRAGANAANTAARSMRALSAGIGAATAVAAGAERSFVSLGTSILSAFAAGGRQAGLTSIVGGAVDRIERGFREALDAMLREFRLAGASARLLDLAEGVARRLMEWGAMPRGEATHTGPLLRGPVVEPSADMLRARVARAGATKALSDSLAELERVVGEETREG